MRAPSDRCIEACVDTLRKAALRGPNTKSPVLASVADFWDLIETKQAVSSQALSPQSLWRYVTLSSPTLTLPLSIWHANISECTNARRRMKVGFYVCILRSTRVRK